MIVRLAAIVAREVGTTRSGVRCFSVVPQTDRLGPDSVLVDTLDAADTSSDAQPKPDEPNRIGRFVVLDRLGVGAMGVVYSAYDQQLDRKVAIKLLHAEQREARTRLLREAQAMAKLSHPNVVQVFEVGTQADQVFLAMELVRGSTLRHWQDARPRATQEIIDVYVQAGQGLAHAHAKGLVHRDFKPENVLVGHDGRVRVLDFGLARPEGRSRRVRRTAIPGTIRRQDSLGTELTRDGELVGTPAYMAPEVYGGGHADPLSDQFSFCVALFETLYGKRPFRGGTVAELSAAVVNGALATAGPGPQGAERLRKTVLRGLSVEPGERFPDMAALLEAMAPPRRRRKLPWIAGGLGVVGIAAAAIAVLDRGAVVQCDEPPLSAGMWTDAPREQDPVATPLIDAYVDAWTVARAEACAPLEKADAESVQVSATERACIDARGRELASLLRVASNTDGEDLAGLHRAVRALHPMERCQNPKMAQSMLPAPVDDEHLDAASRVRLKLGHVWALNDLGDFNEAFAVAKAARKQAAQLADRALEANALFVLSYMTSQTGRQRESRALLDEAIIAAEAASDDHRLSLALSFAAITSMFDGRLEESEDMRRRAQAAADAFGPDEELEAWLAFYEGSRDGTDASIRIERLDRALELYTKIAGPESQEVVGTLHNLGEALIDLGRLDAAYRHLDERRRALEAMYGPASSHLVYEYNALARLRLQQGDVDGATEWNDKAIVVTQKTGPTAHKLWVQVRRQQARIALEVGDLDSAVQSLRHGVEQAIAGTDEPDTLAKMRVTMGYALVVLDRAAEAVSEFENAEAGLADRLSRPQLRAHALYPSLVRGWIWAALQSGELGTARALFERAPSGTLTDADKRFFAARLSADGGGPDETLVAKALTAHKGRAKPKDAIDRALAERAGAWLRNPTSL